MNNSDELFQLIQLLSKAEKRQFKILSGNNSGKVKNYIKLFDHLAKQEEYNEEELIRKFRNEAFVQHLSSTKYKLLVYILRSLSSLNTGNPIEREIKEMISFVEILYFKGLLKQSQRWLHKAKSLAHEYEDFYTLLTIFSWEKKLLFERPDENLSISFDSIIEEEKLVQQKLENLIQYKNFLYKMTSLFSKQLRVRNDEEEKLLAEVAASPFLDKKKPQSISAQIVFHEVHYKYLLKKNQHKAAWQELNDLLKIYDNEGKKFIDFDVETYLRVNLNFINISILTNNLNAVECSLERMKYITEHSGFHEFKTREKIFYAQLLYYMNSHQWEKGHQLATEIKEYMANHEFMFKRSKILIIYYNIAMLYFIRQDYEESLYWLNKILNQPKTELRKDSQAIARIMRMLVLYELNNKDLLDDLIRSTQRHLTLNNYKYEFEQSLLVLLKDLISVTNENEVIEKCSELEEKINKLNESQEMKQIGQDEVLLWVKSKIHKKKIVDILEEEGIKKEQEPVE